jgi:hypothetical protein
MGTRRGTKGTLHTLSLSNTAGLCVGCGAPLSRSVRYGPLPMRLAWRGVAWLAHCAKQAGAPAATVARDGHARARGGARARRSPIPIVAQARLCGQSAEAATIWSQRMSPGLIWALKKTSAHLRTTKQNEHHSMGLRCRLGTRAFGASSPLPRHSDGRRFVDSDSNGPGWAAWATQPPLRSGQLAWYQGLAGGFGGRREIRSPQARHAGVACPSPAPRIMVAGGLGRRRGGAGPGRGSLPFRTCPPADLVDDARHDRAALAEAACPGPGSWGRH